MIAVELTDDEVQEVLKERFAHPCPKVQMRMEVMHLRNLGKPYAEIMEIVGCSRRSISRWLSIYSNGGLEGLKVIDYNRRPGALEAHQGTLESWFKDNPPASIREAMARIKELTGIERSERVVREFLRSIGMSYRKTGRVPGRANREAQEEYKKKAWSLGSRRQRTATEKCIS